VAKRLGMAAVRYGIPLAMAIAGIVALAIGGDAAGAGIVLIGSGAIVLLLNVLFRISIVSNRERDVEEEARRYYDRHGHWPDGTT
jgi:hypothetical protein